MQATILEKWGKKPFLIAGPCSAETEEQVLETAVRLKITGKIDLLRSGIWKPRTRPGSFEGVGEIGFEWLKKAKDLTGLPLTIEVATPQQVELALKNSIDVLWIGARTTVNPFSIQALADTLQNVEIPILIKNPVNPDLELWVGAIERFSKAGIKHIGLIHRGFSSYGDMVYRNTPMWHLAIEMRRRFPELMLIGDPSHICGRRDILGDVAQTAIDLNFDGLMIESHIQPDEAWSDAKQQITPENYQKLIENIRWRQSETAVENFTASVSSMRDSINQIDDQLLKLLSERMKIAETIGTFKKENNITILQTNRWNHILERAIAIGLELNLSKEFIIRYLEAVHLESINHQYKVMKGE